VNPAFAAYAFLYGGGGARFISAIAAIFLVPMYLRQRTLAAGAILPCLAVSIAVLSRRSPAAWRSSPADVRRTPSLPAIIDP
jgi:hypothetical protein